jgi:hypothetical protein
MDKSYRPMPGDHFGEMLIEAIARFAVEDHCTVDEWMRSAVRQCALTRLSGEAEWGGYKTLSAQLRQPQPGSISEALQRR